QHAFELFFAGGNARRIQESFPNHPPQTFDVRRQAEQIGQKAPRKRALAVKPARRGGPKFLEGSLAPVLDLVTLERFLALQILLRFQKGGITRRLGNLIELLLPAQEFNIVFVRQREDVAAIVELRAARPAKYLMGGARIDRLLLAERAF